MAVAARLCLVHMCTLMLRIFTSEISMNDLLESTQSLISNEHMAGLIFEGEVTFSLLNKVQMFMPQSGFLHNIIELNSLITCLLVVKSSLAEVVKP